MCPSSSSNIIIVAFAMLLHLARAQYEGPSNLNLKKPPVMAYGPQEASHGYDMTQNEIEEQDDRPKIRFGIRLRVPAFKVDLPPVNLPKITIHAKLKQPNTVRTIRVPAINLDTSSHLSGPSDASSSLSVGPMNSPLDPGDDYGKARQPPQSPANYIRGPRISLGRPNMEPGYNTQTLSISTGSNFEKAPILENMHQMQYGSSEIVPVRRPVPKTVSMGYPRQVFGQQVQTSALTQSASQPSEVRSLPSALSHQATTSRPGWTRISSRFRRLFI